MINEVNKLIYYALIKHQAVYLPNVGTINVVRHSAKMSSKREILPPHYDIEYSSDDHAKSLVDIISECVSVDATRAEEIYSRWLDKVSENGVIVIDRVGTLHDKNFAPEKALIKALNIANEPVRVTRRMSNAPLYVVLSFAIICALGYGGWWYYNMTQQALTPLEIAQPVVVAEEIELPSVIDVQDANVEEVAEVEESVSEPENVEDTIVDWRTREDIRHWVVVGSYSTTQNAERAIADIVKRMPQMQCSYIKLGSMYAVAIFGSSDNEECQEYKRTYVKEFSQSWVYTPKRFR